MSQDQYKIKISPESIKSDLSEVNYNGNEFGVYSAMTQVVSSGPNGTSIMTGLTIPILLRQTAVDVGYFSPFDGAVLQKEVVTNFIFSSDTSNPYTYKVYNTSADYQKFLELSLYTVDWGDGSVKQNINQLSPNYIEHTYPKVDGTFKITLEQTNPWGKNKVTKTITVPYTDVEIPNPNGEAFFIPLGGSWSATPVSYDFIFSGDSENEVSKQTSVNYVSVPFTVSGITKSRVTELALYGTPKYQVGTPVILNGQIWGAISDMNDIYTAYTINQVNYYDYVDGTTIFFEESSGLTSNNIVAVPITKEEVLIKVIDQPQIQTDVFVERGKNSGLERIMRFGEVDNLGDLLNYGYGFFNVEKKD
jgi:hypothetical protein